MHSPARSIAPSRAQNTAQSILAGSQSNELFVALVGPAGAGAGTAAKIISTIFGESGYQSKIIKASGLIRKEAERLGLDLPNEDARKSINSIRMMQDRGDDLRKGDVLSQPEDHSAIARLIARAIAISRAELQGETFDGNSAVIPNGEKRVFIIDSLRHPSEAFLLRRIYHDAFSLIGVICDPQIREKRLTENLFDRSLWGNSSTVSQVNEFMERDQDAPEKYGQHVSDTFYQSDYFLDNSEEGSSDLTVTGMNDQIARFVSLMTHQNIVRPTIAETAMHHARSAQMRSACLSRQVGATLVDSNGNIVATGTNEVPKAGGGVYGESFEIENEVDDRCAFRDTVYCSSNREQNNIIEDLIDKFPEISDAREKEEIFSIIRKTRVGGLIEFSRAVHAEMDAILSAARVGVSPLGCRLFVTTYPCHYCARHIVSSGIDEVQFIEPYPKSRATALHEDSIESNTKDWIAPSKRNTGAAESNPKVLFRPFTGVSPRLYRRVFLKDRDYKNKMSGELDVGNPVWGSALDTYKVAYTNLEIELGSGISDE